MNQILSTNLNNKKNLNKKNWFKFQFGVSILIIFIIIFLVSIYYYDLLKKENLSNSLVNNYSIYKLYNTQNSNNKIEENLNGLFRNY